MQTALCGSESKLFISPRVFEKGDNVELLYLTHELSHLHLLQKLGFYKMSRLPFWFKEGWATYVSEGGGADLISQQDAIESIRAGRHFVPNKVGGFIFQKTPTDFGLHPQMFYRQSMLFVEYLASHESSQFKEMIVAIYNGENFPVFIIPTENPLENYGLGLSIISKKWAHKIIHQTARSSAALTLESAVGRW